MVSEKFPYICKLTENGKEFVPTMIDYDGREVWCPGFKADENGEWCDFDEVTFEKNKKFKDL